MSGRQSSAVEAAVKEYKKVRRGVYRIAARHKIAPSSLYRAIRNGSKK